MAFSRDLTKSGISVSLIVAAVVVMSIKCRFAILFFGFSCVRWCVVHPPQFPISFLSRFLCFSNVPIPSDYRQANTIPFIKIRFHRWMFYVRFYIHIVCCVCLLGSACVFVAFSYFISFPTIELGVAVCVRACRLCYAVSCHTAYHSAIIKRKKWTEKSTWKWHAHHEKL